MKDAVCFLVMEMSDGNLSASPVQPPEDDTFDNFRNLPGAKSGRATLVKLRYSPDGAEVTVSARTKFLPILPDPNSAEKKLGESL